MYDLCLFLLLQNVLPSKTYCKDEVMVHFYPDSKVHGANLGPTWVLSAPGGPHVCLMNLAIWVRNMLQLVSLKIRVYVPTLNSQQ